MLMDAGVTGILLAHQRAFGSGELKSLMKILPEVKKILSGHKIQGLIHILSLYI